jgi:hypothetical protein
MPAVLCRYYAQTSFTAATRIHNAVHGLYRFSDEPNLAMQVTRHLHSQRGSLYKKRFEEAYFLHWVVRFCQEYCPSQLQEIDLNWPLDALVERVSMLALDTLTLIVGF